MTSSDTDRELLRATLLYRLELATQLKRRTARTILNPAPRFHPSADPQDFQATESSADAAPALQ